MSRVNYNQPAPPPPQGYYPRPDGGGVFGANGYKNGYNNIRPNGYLNNYPNGYNNNYRNEDNRYDYRNNQYLYRSPSPYYRQTIFYNRNYQPQRYDNNRYNRGRYNSGYMNRQPVLPLPEQLNRNRSGSRSVGNSRQQQQQQQQQRRYAPRQPILGDYWPSQLREEFDIATATNAVTAPADALPQRQQNTTQPFVVNNNPEKDQRRTVTTSAFRRRQHRNRQQQYRQNQSNNNRFALFAEGEVEEKADEVEDDNFIESSADGNAIRLMNNKKTKNKKNTKLRYYLQENRILTRFKDNPSLKDNRTCAGTRTYLLSVAPIFDGLIRTYYELQVWENYLKMGKDDKHWAKEVVRRTKKRDETENIRFINKKLNQLSSKIDQANARIAELQIQLGDYWAQVSSRKKAVSVTGRIHNDIEELEKSILNYIKECTEYVKNMAGARVQLAKVQKNEYKALEEFHQSATPLHWQTHLILKPKLKTWSTKHKNYCIAQERVVCNLRDGPRENRLLREHGGQAILNLICYKVRP